MDSAFGLGCATPAAVAQRVAGACTARARHAADGREAELLERMPRQAGALEQSVDLLAAGASERIEFQPLSVKFDDRNARPLAAMVALASVDPCIEARKCARKR